LVDAPDLGSGAARRGGSSPFTRTIFIYISICCVDFLGQIAPIEQVQTP
jgi:hypothetical protein